VPQRRAEFSGSVAVARTPPTPARLHEIPKHLGSVTMENQSSARSFGAVRLSVARFTAMVLCLFATFWASAASLPLTIKVIGVAADGKETEITTDYRWTVEEDATKPSVPGLPATKANYSFSFHTSYMPVVAAGRVGTASSKAHAACAAAAASAAPRPAGCDPDVYRLYTQTLPSLDDTKRYYVSVAAEGFQMGGAPVVFGASAAAATVYVNQYNLPTAQVSVFAFEDNNPINGAPDLPQETGLAGFTVVLNEAGGTYGQSGGAVTQDAFGNPLGTTYSDDQGTVLKRGNGIILTGPDGTATIKNLFPAKYTVVIVPPVGSDWHQTSTIEGTRGQDAWVKNNEPSFFQEYGPPGHHVFIGFTRSGFLARNANNAPVLNGTRTITGRIVNIHNSRPPEYTFFNGAPVPECWVGLNETNGGTRALYATACRKDSTFTIPNVPNGTYELVVWDDPLDMIIGTTTVTVNNANVAMGDVPVFSWFARYQGRVFQDIDGTGLPYFAKAWDRPYIEVDPVTGVEREVTKHYNAGDLKPPFGEGIANNIRFRDGSIYQSVTTKKDGTFSFNELFPFFNWMIAEIDYARFKATGATMVTDAGGSIPVVADPNSPTKTSPDPSVFAKLWKAETGLYGSNDPAFAYNPFVRLNPQAHPCSLEEVEANTNSADPNGCTTVGQTRYFRQEQGVVLLEGMQTFLGQTNHIEWGKQPYAFNENGGIAGIVHYAITRAEDDPRFAAAENWEPGIPHVQVNLYLDCDGDGIPDKPLNDGTGQCVAGAAGLSSLGYQYKKPDVDNFPFCWSEGSCPKGPEDVVNSGDGITFSEGDVFKWGAGDNLAVGIGTTDSWDDKIPTGCPKSTSALQGGNGGVTSPVIADLDCFDGLYNFNQLRAAVFDGGYAFGRVAGQAELPMLIGAEGKGKYIVEAVAPPGYLHQGNGDKNVVFGDQLKSAPAALPFECVGELLDVPANLTLFPGEPNPNYGSPQYPNNKWRKCDMKAVPLVPGTNPAPDFYMFTEAPVAGHGVGFILDDTASEFNRFAPTFGEKYAPPHLPVSVQDWTGREITRVYSDQFGSYNFLVPSSFTINPPYPSGVMPSMMVSCMNHPGPITDERPTINGQPNPTFGQKIIDPFFNRKYTQFCYTLQYLPGKTTYLDTPVLPIAAFASVEKNPLDCECQDGTPAIYSATNGDNGPWLPSGGGVLTIVSTGSAVEVANPAYDPTDPASPKLITRDYGFGSTSGTVRIGSTTLSLASAWSKDGVAVNVPAGVSGQLSVTRGDNGKESVVGLTVHSGNPAPRKVNAGGVDAAGCGLGASLPCKTIQRAIDESSAANNTNTLITVAPGTYNEYVIVDKRVRLQGWGSGSVAINASKASAGGLAAWRALLNKKVDARCGTPNGSTDTAHCPANTPIDPDTGNPTIVAGNDRTFDPLPGQTLGINSGNNEPLLFGAEEGPGILVVGRGNGNGTNCANTNSALRIDGLTVTGSDAGGGILASGYACNLQITNNRVVANYGTYGGGIRVGHTDLVDGDVFTDAVNRNVSIHHNWVAENGATESGGGGGITMGTGSTAYQVTDNYVCGNFSMSDGGGVSHWGVSNGTIAHNRILLNQTFFQGGNPTGGGVFVGGQAPVGGGDSPGTGNVTVDANLIQYNNAGAGAGGGMSIARTATGDALIVTNNMIVNNASGFAGGGVALAEIRGTGVRLVNNTIADNASTATNQESFPAGPKVLSTAQIAGVALRPGAGTSTPTLLNNIVWGNRSYRWSITPSNPNQPQTTVLTDAGIWDLGVVGNASHTALASIRSIVTEAITAGAATCTNCSIASASQLAFLKPITFTPATDPDQPGVLPETTVMQTALTFDEGGNFINVIFSPLTPWDITAGPTFGSARANYHIDDGSVAVNAGEDRTAANRVPTTDHDGESRPVTGVDIGADELPIRANLAVTITDNRTTVTPGTTGVTYVIVVTNSGPTAVTGATLSDALPGAARLAVTSWTCAASAGSSCTTGGSGNSTRSGLMNLAINGTVTYTVVGNVPAGAPAGASTNTVTVAPPAGVTDPNPANNTASDTDTILAPAASLSTILLNFGDVATGATATSVVTMSNTGTAPLTITSAVVSGTRFGKGADSCTGVSVAPGNSCTVAVTFNPNNGLPRIGALTFTDNAGTQAVVLTGI
jgi:uncharacterized repeat protein (TIGR01451 family)